MNDKTSDDKKAPQAIDPEVYEKKLRERSPWTGKIDQRISSLDWADSKGAKADAKGASDSPPIRVFEKEQKPAEQAAESAGVGITAGRPAAVPVASDTRPMPKRKRAWAPTLAAVVIVFAIGGYGAFFSSSSDRDPERPAVVSQPKPKKPVPVAALSVPEDVLAVESGEPIVSDPEWDDMCVPTKPGGGNDDGDAGACMCVAANAEPVVVEPGPEFVEAAPVVVQAAPVVVQAAPVVKPPEPAPAPPNRAVVVQKVPVKAAPKKAALATKPQPTPVKKAPPQPEPEPDPPAKSGAEADKQVIRITEVKAPNTKAPDAPPVTNPYTPTEKAPEKPKVLNPYE